MPEIAISVQNIGKCYQLGKREAYSTLADTVSNKVKSIFIGKKGGEKSFWALDGVSFDIKKGEVVGIIGRNGAGKSTLLKILSRITYPTTGNVEIHGRIGSLLEVGTGFHPELTGRENIYLSGSILGMKRTEIKNKFDEIVNFAEIQQFIDTPVKRYSSGMYVRLAFAVAAHLDPEILLIDEVLAVGDVEFQKKCLNKMQDVSKKGRTILFVSHNMRSIAELCNRCIFLENGKIKEIGDTNKVIELYLTHQDNLEMGAVDLSDAILRKNSLENSKFKWTKIEIFNSDGITTSVIKTHEPFSIKLYGYLDQKFPDIKFAFSIDSIMGFPLFNSFLSDSVNKPEYNAGMMEFSIKFDNNYLGPGFYTISLGANGPGIIDWIPVAIQFHVSDISNEGKPVRNNYVGIIHHPCFWSVRNL